MWPRISIIAGLLTGVAAAALVIGGIIVLAPEPGAAPTPPPQPSASLGLERDRVADAGHQRGRLRRSVSVGRGIPVG